MTYNQVTEIMDLLVDKETIDIDRILHIKQTHLLEDKMRITESDMENRKKDLGG